MSKYKYLTNISECQLDKNDEIIEEFDTNLPHHKQIAEEICKSWNDMDMKQYYDGILKNTIVSCKMTCFVQKPEMETVICIEFIMKPGLRLTEKYKNAIREQTHAQMCDGWGESFFGYINVMTDDCGQKFIVE